MVSALIIATAVRYCPAVRSHVIMAEGLSELRKHTESMYLTDLTHSSAQEPLCARETMSLHQPSIRD